MRSASESIDALCVSASSRCFVSLTSTSVPTTSPLSSGAMEHRMSKLATDASLRTWRICPRYTPPTAMAAREAAPKASNSASDGNSRRVLMPTISGTA